MIDTLISVGAIIGLVVLFVLISRLTRIENIHRDNVERYYVERNNKFWM